MMVLDHIVVAAESLSEGRDFVETLLGVSMQSGGRHELMGTHNLLLGLCDGLYLEVISINPDAPAPMLNRWFGLDEFCGEPRLINWVAQSDDLHSDIATIFGSTASPKQLKRGDLNWEMSVLDEGQTPFDGLAPMMLDWGNGPKASERLEPSGCRVSEVILQHPDISGLSERVSGLIKDPRVHFEYQAKPNLKAVLQTPRGEVVL